MELTRFLMRYTAFPYSLGAGWTCFVDDGRQRHFSITKENDVRRDCDYDSYCDAHYDFGHVDSAAKTVIC